MNKPFSLSLEQTIVLLTTLARASADNEGVVSFGPTDVLQAFNDAKVEYTQNELYSIWAVFQS